MTDNGTFVINGTERVVVSQLFSVVHCDRGKPTLPGDLFPRIII